MLLFDTKGCVPILLKNKNPYIRLAIEDLRADFSRVSTVSHTPRLTDTEELSCIVIEENDARIEDPIEDESFCIRAEGSILRISAPTYFGTMWAIYTVSREMLGISPCYLFDDFPIERKEKIEISDTEISEKGTDFGFRGIFINDEDLLTGWKKSDGRRNMDYPWYQSTVAAEVIDRITETALRLQMNLVIPASFLDIDNPAEKLLADRVARRGIYLSQHHIEPLGVSHFTLENYCKKYGRQGEYSYLHFPALLEEAWRAYTKKWAGYERVVWQLGLRGKADRPVWEEEKPTEQELCAYGKFISNAIERQRAIVLSETKGRARHFTSTLWMEGSALAERGYLSIDPSVCLVFSDNGPNQMFGADYDRVLRVEERKYGIYYHLQYFDIGPHLAPQTGVDKIFYNISRAYGRGDRAYLILNASNLREFTFELSYAASLLWRVDGAKDFTERYCGAHFGKEAARAEALIRRYFDSLPTLPTSELSNVHAKYFNYNYGEDSGEVKNFVIKDGLISSRGEVLLRDLKAPLEDGFCEKLYLALLGAEPIFRALCEDFSALAENLDGGSSHLARTRWWLHAKTLHSLYLWFIRVFEAKRALDLGDRAKAASALSEALSAIDGYLCERKIAEYGDFANWFSEDTKLNIPEKAALTREAAKKLQGI